MHIVVIYDAHKRVKLVSHFETNKDLWSSAGNFEISTFFELGNLYDIYMYNCMRFEWINALPLDTEYRCDNTHTVPFIHNEETFL